MISPIVSIPIQESSPTQAAKTLREAAVQLEASFLAEMLKSAGLHSSPSLFGGGSGEDQFSSFLIREHALHMARAGGIGLAETVFRAMKQAPNEN